MKQICKKQNMYVKTKGNKRMEMCEKKYLKDTLNPHGINERFTFC